MDSSSPDGHTDPSETYSPRNLYCQAVRLRVPSRIAKFSHIARKSSSHTEHVRRLAKTHASSITSLLAPSVFLGDYQPGQQPQKRQYEVLMKVMRDMVHPDPSARPTIDEVIVRFDEITKNLSSWKLRSRPVKRDDSWILGVFRSVAHWRRRIVFVARRVPAVPTPRS